MKLLNFKYKHNIIRNNSKRSCIMQEIIKYY